MISINNLTKIYNRGKSNEFEALHGISLQINDGELVAITGRSGAGKSTLLHILACIDDYQSGELRIDGTLVKGLSDRQYACIRNEKALAALKAAGVEELAKKPCSKLSGGQKQRVAVARAIAGEPSVILADEPTGALDSKTADEIMQLFKSLNEQGRTVIIVTHDKSVAMQCGRVIEISDGKVIQKAQPSASP